MMTFIIVLCLEMRIYLHQNSGDIGHTKYAKNLTKNFKLIKMIIVEVESINFKYSTKTKKAFHTLS
jgi:hypothetical protein